MRRRPKPTMINPKARRRQQQRVARLITLSILALLVIQVIAARYTILKAIGEYLVLQQQIPERADLIVIPANWDDTIVRVRGAVDLYRGEVAHKIFVPRMAQMEGAEEIKRLGVPVPENRDVVVAILQGLGVPLSAIETTAQEVEDTWDEARETRGVVEKMGYKVVLLVTSKYHSRRAALIFQDALKERAKVISLPSPYDPSEPSSWWTRNEDAKRVVMEYAKLIVYYWRKVF